MKINSSLIKKQGTRIFPFPNTINDNDDQRLFACFTDYNGRQHCLPINNRESLMATIHNRTISDLEIYSLKKSNSIL